MNAIFQPSPPSTEQAARLNALRSAYASLEAVLAECAGPCRETSLAMTNLEQSAQWARQAVLASAPVKPQPGGRP